MRKTIPLTLASVLSPVWLRAALAPKGGLGEQVPVEALARLPGVLRHARASRQPGLRQGRWVQRSWLFQRWREQAPGLLCGLLPPGEGVSARALADEERACGLPLWRLLVDEHERLRSRLALALEQVLVRPGVLTPHWAPRPQAWREVERAAMQGELQRLGEQLDEGHWRVEGTESGVKVEGRWSTLKVVAQVPDRGGVRLQLG